MSERKKTPSEIDAEALEIRGRMEIEDIVRLQINRCNVSATHENPDIFNFNVLALRDNLPQHKRIEVIDRYLEYGEVKIEKWFTQWWCGQGVKGSEVIKKILHIDHHKLFQIVLDAFADCGLTWKIEPEMRELGKKEFIQEQPTPIFKEKIDSDD